MIKYKIKLKRTYTSEVVIMAKNGEQAVKKAMKTPLPTNPDSLEVEPEILSAQTEEDINKEARDLVLRKKIIAEVDRNS